MNINVSIAETYTNRKNHMYKDFVKQLSSISIFEDDVWICDKKRKNAAQKPHDYSVYFKSIPEVYKDTIKYFSVMKLSEGTSVRTVDSIIQLLKSLCMYAQKLNLTNLMECASVSFVNGFKAYLDSIYKNDSTKIMQWVGAKRLFDVINVCEDKKIKNMFCDCPYEMQRKRNLAYKYIPEVVASQADRIFKGEDTPLCWRLMYWVLRLMPSRVSEACAIGIDCIKAFDNRWVLFIPTWKQNGGYKQPEIRSIHLENTGYGKFLIDLIREQQVQAKKLQKYLNKNDRGLLFTYKMVYHGIKLHRNIREKEGNVYTTTPEYVNCFLKKICQEHNVKNSDGKPYIITSHQFRHTGISDRLEDGFTPEQVTLMTGHRGESMIINSYNHIDLKQDLIIEKQMIVNGCKEDVDKALFKGRILNMDEALEQRILSNVRAHRVRGGLCSDITNCSCDMFSCLNCNFFVPEIEQLQYFREQIIMWAKKAEKFKDFQIIVKNAQANMLLNHAIVDKIEKMKGEIIYEIDTNGSKTAPRESEAGDSGDDKKGN